MSYNKRLIYKGRTDTTHGEELRASADARIFMGSAMCTRGYVIVAPARSTRQNLETTSPPASSAPPTLRRRFRGGACVAVRAVLCGARAGTHFLFQGRAQYSCLRAPVGHSNTPGSSRRGTRQTLWGQVCGGRAQPTVGKSASCVQHDCEPNRRPPFRSLASLKEGEHIDARTRQRRARSAAIGTCCAW